MSYRPVFLPGLPQRSPRSARCSLPLSGPFCWLSPFPLPSPPLRPWALPVPQCEGPRGRSSPPGPPGTGWRAFLCPPALPVLKEMLMWLLGCYCCRLLFPDLVAASVRGRAAAGRPASTRWRVRPGEVPHAYPLLAPAAKGEALFLSRVPIKPPPPPLPPWPVCPLSGGRSDTGAGFNRRPELCPLSLQNLPGSRWLRNAERLRGPRGRRPVAGGGPAPPPAIPPPGAGGRGGFSLKKWALCFGAAGLPPCWWSWITKWDIISARFLRRLLSLHPLVLGWFFVVCFWCGPCPPLFFFLFSLANILTAPG